MRVGKDSAPDHEEGKKTHTCSEQDENDADRGKYCRKEASKQTPLS